MRILIIEDDEKAAKILNTGLNESGHSSCYEADATLGLSRASNDKFDVLIIDRMMPKLDGLTLIKILREQGCTTPILILSAMGEIDERVEGLRSGGDDYLVKPYAFAELLARIELLAKRIPNEIENETTLTVADLEFDLNKKTASRNGTVIRLQPRSVRLLEYLMRHAGQVVTRKMLLEQVWGIYFEPDTNVIDAQISRLRSEIDKGFSLPLLHTIRGKGYLLGEK